MALSSENLEIWVNWREYSRPIQTATYPPFTKGTYPMASVKCGSCSTRRTDAHALGTETQSHSTPYIMPPPLRGNH